eukprot:g632.t1
MLNSSLRSTGAYRDSILIPFHLIMLDMREADRITTQSNTESKFSTSSQGSGVFWKPMVYLTSSDLGK